MKPPPDRIYKAKHWPHPKDMPLIGEHVHGMYHHDGATIWIGWIHTFQPGEGWVGKYLDSLPTNRRVVVPSVINAVLAGMLLRRGFKFHRRVFTAYGGEAVDGYVREARR